MKRTFFYLFIFFMAKSTIAQSGLPMKKITIFKNGTALVVREGTIPLKGTLGLLPIPTFALSGTYFLGTAKENPIKNLEFKNDTIKRKEKVSSLWHLVAANIGKNATISFSPMQKIDKQISGKILDVDLNAGIAKVKQENGKVASISSTDIYLVETAEEGNSMYMADSITRMINIHTEKSGESIAAQEFYMQSNINWMPSYFLKLKDAQNARLEMKAIVENFSDELNDVETELIVGAPQMINSGELDPMTYDYYTATNEAAALQKNYMYSNAMQTKSNYAALDAAAPARDFESNFQTQGEKLDDQYIYKIGKISLKRESKGSFPIFANNLEYKHKYEASIYDKTNFFNTRFCDNAETLFDVYHSLEIKNVSNVPLTTAPVTVINEKEQFLAQDEIKYTPIGATANVRLSKAIDIVLKNTEEETFRNEAAKKVGKVNYAQVKLKGTVLVENFSDKDVAMTVKKEVNGAVLSATDEGKILKKKSYNYYNPFSEIKWDITVKKGEKRTINYEYEVFFVM